MSLRIKIRRATESQLNSAASAGSLLQAEPYLLTDVEKLAIGTSANSYFIVGASSGGGLGDSFILNFNTTTTLTTLPQALGDFIDSILSNTTSHDMFKIDLIIVLKGISGSNNYSYTLNTTCTAVRTATPRFAVSDLKVISYSGVRLNTGTVGLSPLVLGAENMTAEVTAGDNDYIRFKVKHSMPGTTASLPSQAIINIYKF